MKNKRELNKIWSQVPPNYYDNATETNLLQKYWHSQKINTLQKLIAFQKFKKILDVGCAGGYMANKVNYIFPKSKITGIDVYKESIDYAKKKYPNINFIVADAHKLPFKDNTFDMVICYETIEHVVNPKKVLAEIKRVMKKNGKALVVMDSGSPLFRGVWYVWENTKGKVWKGAHLHPFHHTELEKVIKSVGLKISKKHFSHFGMEVSFLLKK